MMILGGISVPRAIAQALPALEIRQANQFEFQTSDGAAYMVEGSQDGLTWTGVAGPIFGDGSISRTTMPPATTAYPQWRVRVLNEATLLPGTSQFGGKTLALNDGGRARQLIFFPTIQGVRRGILKTDASHVRSFTWKPTRQTASTTLVRLEYFDGTSATVNLNFSTSQLGSYQLLDKDATGTVQVSEAGSFSLQSGRIQDTLQQTKLPLLIGGQQWLLEEGGAMTRFDFGTDGTVTLNRPDGSTEKRNYRYTRGTNPAQGTINLDSPNTPGHSYQIAMGTQATGNYNRMPLPTPGQPLPPGSLPQSGTVTVPVTPVATHSTTGPPASLSGKTLQLNGDDPVTLTFNSDGTGTASREDGGTVEITPFTYDYSPTGDEDASLALTYPGAQTDRVEDYDLDFSAGTGGNYRSSTYQGGELAQSTSGSFNASGS